MKQFDPDYCDHIILIEKLNKYIDYLNSGNYLNLPIKICKHCFELFYDNYSEFKIESGYCDICYSKNDDIITNYKNEHKIQKNKIISFVKKIKLNMILQN